MLQDSRLRITSFELSFNIFFVKNSVEISWKSTVFRPDSGVRRTVSDLLRALRSPALLRLPSPYADDRAFRLIPWSYCMLGTSRKSFSSLGFDCISYPSESKARGRQLVGSGYRQGEVVLASKELISSSVSVTVVRESTDDDISWLSSLV